MMTNFFPIADIIVQDRVRDAVRADVEQLAVSIKSEGLINPITLRDLGQGKARLVAGLHRLEAVKLLGEAAIQCTWQNLTTDSVADDLTEASIECDENLKRNDLVEGMRALFVDRRRWVEDRRIRWKALEEARARVEAAKKGTKEEKEAAKKQLQRARASWDGNDEEGTGNLPAGGLSVPRVSKGVREALSLATGMTRDQIERDVTIVNTHGKEVLKLASQIRLDGKEGKATTRAELAALAKLKSDHPERHVEVINSWRSHVEKGKGSAKRPSSVLADIGKRAKSDDRKDARATVEGAVEELLKTMSKIKSLLTDVVPVLPTATKGANIRDIPQKIRNMREQAEEMRSLLVNVRNGLKNA